MDKEQVMPLLYTDEQSVEQQRDADYAVLVKERKEIAGKLKEINKPVSHPKFRIIHYENELNALIQELEGK